MVWVALCGERNFASRGGDGDCFEDVENKSYASTRVVATFIVDCARVVVVVCISGRNM